jgi:hypothetical protein
MGRRGAGVEVEITEGAIRVRSQGRALTIPNAPRPADDEGEEADFVVYLDDIAHWDPPDDETTIEIDELQKILDAIERELERRGLSVEFE